MVSPCRLETAALEHALETLETTAPNETDRADREAELPRDVAVRQRRFAEKQQRDHVAAARRQLRDRLAQHLFPLHLFDEVGRRIRFEPLLVRGRQLVFRAAVRLPLPLIRL